MKFEHYFLDSLSNATHLLDIFFGNFSNWGKIVIEVVSNLIRVGYNIVIVRKRSWKVWGGTLSIDYTINTLLNVFHVMRIVLKVLTVLFFTNFYDWKLVSIRFMFVMEFIFPSRIICFNRLAWKFLFTDIDPRRYTTSFQRRYDVVRCHTTLYRH